MLFIDSVLRFIVIVVLAAGFVWAIAIWRSRRQTAALVAAACALQLAVRLIWLPGVRLLFGTLTWSSSPVQRFFIWTGNALSQLALVASFALLIFAALDPANRRA